jgi:hypothetical protein
VTRFRDARTAHQSIADRIDRPRKRGERVSGEVPAASSGQNDITVVGVFLFFSRNDEGGQQNEEAPAAKGLGPGPLLAKATYRSIGKPYCMTLYNLGMWTIKI